MTIQSGIKGGRAIVGDGISVGEFHFVPMQSGVLFFDYSAESRNWSGGVVRFRATSHLVNRLAAVREPLICGSPVGFTYIGELINEDEIVLGDQESAGLPIQSYRPQKDGVPSYLPATKAVIASRASITEMDLSRLTGSVTLL